MKLKNTWNKKYKDDLGLKPSKNEIQFSKEINKMKKSKIKKYKDDKNEK